MEGFGIIVIIIIGLLLFSVMGWGLKFVELIFNILGEGCSTSWGCIIWIIVIIIVVMIL